ncbi:MAG: hypothetical protein A2W93_09270 [Bacteroidetes bacterium GWF2_43_63]|nr:MAG: hypothetical protein A2W93_09270 [Bacteroidetes bacterium GWF2_43_63]HBG70435.1 hypothetical protein [Bacteroidales bacterium]HCB63448.1 hypothetical protein [Bacteroidales bacterium]
MKKLLLLSSFLIMTLVMSAQKIETSVYQNWTNDTVWQNWQQRVYEYDSNFVKEVEWRLLWDSVATQWDTTSKIRYVNNATGLPNQIIQTSRDSVTGLFTADSSRYTINYSLSEKEDTVLWEIKTGGVWYDRLRTHFIYDTNDFLITKTGELNYQSPSAWENYSRFEYINNPDGTVQSETIFRWDSVSDAWINSQTTAYTYNAYQKPLTTTIDHNSDGSIDNTIEYFYDASNYLIKTEQSVSSDYYEGYYTNNTSGLPVEIVTQILDDTVMVNFTRIINTYIYNTNDLGEELSFSFNVFPNPAGNVLNIKSATPCSQVLISDLTGKIIYDKQISGSEYTINIESLPAGLYVIVLKNSTGSGARMFVKE